MNLKQEMQDMAKSMPIMKNTLERWAAEVDKVKAEAVRDAIAECGHNGADGQGWESDLEQHANKLEQGK